jgi:CDP-diacylglycerol--glycerol-3-phosphate 3-phosphatidyltransferase
MTQTRPADAGHPDKRERKRENSWIKSAILILTSGGEGSLTLPNWLTLTRILMLPLLVLFLLQGSPASRAIAVTIFITAALTDWLDGYLARKHGQITPLGELLDPVADKLLIMAALLPLVALGKVDAWVVGILLGREFLVTAMRAVALRNGLVVAASPIGKTKMGLEVAAIILLIIELFPPVGTILIWGAMIVSLVSAIDYFRKIARELT